MTNNILPFFMTNQEMKQFLLACQKKIIDFSEAFKEDKAILNAFYIDKDSSYIIIIRSWLEDIYQKIVDDLIPFSFYSYRFLHYHI